MLVLLVFGCILDKVAGELCYKASYTSIGYSSVDSVYCDEGCCGYYYNRSCCTSVGAIVGAAVGGVVCVAIIAIIIACICISHHKNKTTEEKVNDLAKNKKDISVNDVEVDKKQMSAITSSEHGSKSTIQRQNSSHSSIRQQSTSQISFNHSMPPPYTSNLSPSFHPKKIQDLTYFYEAPPTVLSLPGQTVAQQTLAQNGNSELYNIV